MTFEDWLCKTCIIWNAGKDGTVRFGQYLFASLHETRPDIANEILDMDSTFKNGVDPFYLEKNIGNFLAFIHQNWSK